MNTQSQNDIRIAFFGTPELVIPILNELEKTGFTPAILVTGKDVPKGRKMQITPPAPKLWAEARTIPILQPEKIDASFIEAFKKLNIDIGIVVAYGKILPQALLDIPRLGMLNVHYSLLPKYRGATPVESAILAGESETGVVIQKMVFALDAGAVVAEEKVMIGENETAPDLRNRLNEIAKKMLPEAIEKIKNGTALFQEQDSTKATLSKKIKKEDGLIDPAGDPILNCRKFRTYFGWPGSYFFIERDEKKIRVIIKTAELKNGKFDIKTVIPEGKKEMAYADFLKNITSK
jgi:methionyl-tRNA formyltransferase